MSNEIDPKDAADLGLKLVDNPVQPGERAWQVITLPGDAVVELVRTTSPSRLLSRLHVREDGGHVRWVLLEWVMGDHGQDPLALYAVLAHGSGHASGLREARHTYFGENGYVYYVNPAVLTWAFGQLRRWFDFEEDAK